MGRGFEETAYKNYIGNKTYQDNWDAIFGKSKQPTEHKEQGTMSTVLEKGQTEVFTAPAEGNEEAISLKEMDDSIRLVRDLEAKYKLIKEQSDEAFAELSAAKMKVISMLEQAGKTVYVAEGLGRAKVSYEMSVQTPKTPEDKRRFFNWLATNLGQDVADAYQTVNSQSLNSLYNSLTEEYAARGEILSIDGLGEPISRVKLSLTKA